jgi:hypothetical protein
MAGTTIIITTIIAAEVLRGVQRASAASPPAPALFYGNPILRQSSCVEALWSRVSADRFTELFRSVFFEGKGFL